jgi:hypothetical protein
MQTIQTVHRQSCRGSLISTRVKTTVFRNKFSSNIQNTENRKKPHKFQKVDPKFIHTLDTLLRGGVNKSTMSTPGIKLNEKLVEICTVQTNSVSTTNHLDAS